MNDHEIEENQRFFKKYTYIRLIMKPMLVIRTARNFNHYLTQDTLFLYFVSQSVRLDS